ncbi:MAG: peptidoglycan bridge formation glycyltransferase FemA/FemB family protein [Bacteroidales bacterium]|nr:peptidoglycan bridge formation glycyltransferase FemA/FemB family protein [Bacteroidales bacterium]
MLTNIYSKEIEELFKTPIVQQTAFWSVVKKKLGANTLAINFKAQKSGMYANTNSSELIISDLLLIIRKIDKIHSVAYIPYGPELEPDEEFQGLFLEELSECLRSFLPKNCIMIRYDLCWESYWAKDQYEQETDNPWTGIPEIRTQEFRFNFNTLHWNFKKTQFNILPSNTIYLNLSNNTETILQRMKPKTRYNIGLACRKGVTVRPIGMESLEIWYKLYQETAQRNKIRINDINNFRAVLEAKTHNSQSPAEVILLLAELDHKPLAAMFLIITGNRGSYLYGASSSDNRNYMAPYALQWEAIKISKSRGCTEYDMFGVSPNPDPTHPLYGLYKFKIGFGGDLYHSMGCWDYPLDKEKYNCFIASEMNSLGYHIN